MSLRVGSRRPQGVAPRGATRWSRGVRAAVFVVATWAVAAPGASSQQELFEQGNQAYQVGDWSAAIDAYQAVLDAGFVSAALRYNLGNAHFKRGELGPAILEWERALVLAPGDEDVLANLELGRSLTADVVEPLPRFWLFSVVAWWVGLLPRGLLIGVVATAWVVLAVGAMTRTLSRRHEVRRVAGWVAIGGTIVAVLFGTNLVARELGIGQADRGVILAESVPVRSAPADDDNLTLFEVHEGTSVRIDQRAGDWAEVVLADGKVGWVPSEVMGVI